ncbi:DEAH-box ATP-dependent RNA helicase prp43 [Ceratobasidium sp. 428]|nr:DEAH-box ATP-dependent RNA helicase prp43 [Ceratobasidium sp. 428]
MADRRAHDGDLAHRFAGTVKATTSRDPFRSLVMRQVNGAGARTILEAKLNPFTNNPYSEKYKRILADRRCLPAFAQMEAFYKIFNQNQIMVVIGATGTGKTTQLPQFVVYTDMPHTRSKLVACTQPRRIAATSVARRVAEEMDGAFVFYLILDALFYSGSTFKVQLGKQVGYSIRFEDMTQEGTTFLKYMTDGMLLREG